MCNFYATLYSHKPFPFNKSRNDRACSEFVRECVSVCMVWLPAVIDTSSLALSCTTSSTQQNRNVYATRLLQCRRISTTRYVYMMGLKYTNNIHTARMGACMLAPPPRPAHQSMEAQREQRASAAAIAGARARPIKTLRAQAQFHQVIRGGFLGVPKKITDA